MFRNRDIISILDFNKNELEELFKVARLMEKVAVHGTNILVGKILGEVFFEPSTRTRLSFQSAMYRLGGKVISLVSPSTSSIAKGENLADTIRMIESYSDIIVIRHRIEGAAKLAAEVSSKPIINAGDGTHHHPTQAMIDLYTIKKYRGYIDGLNIGVLGDLKYGRAANSFIYGLTLFKPDKIYLISPKSLRPRERVLKFLDKIGINYDMYDDVKKVIKNIDVLYVTRIQKERFPHPAEYEAVKGSYRIDLKILDNVKKNLMIMHPLPRIDEISLDVDNTPYAYYFKQAALGVPVRMALISLILGVVK